MKSRFCELLRGTGRENVEYVIEDLETYGFFEAPASVRNHLNTPGGLVEHSLNVYDAAMMLRESIIKRRPDMEKKLPVDAVTLAALLHDVCKANIYRLVTRKRKNEIGMWEEVQEYEVNYSQLPIGHGEKSVVMLAITMATIDMSFIRILRLGPEVSLKGSPTVSPTTVAL